MTTGRRWSWVDLVPALPLLAIGLIGTGPASDDQPGSTQVPDLPAYLLVCLACLSLLLRRRSGYGVLVACGAALVTYLALDYPFGPILFTGPAAVYAVVASARLRPAVLASIAFAVATTGAVALRFLEHVDGWLGLLTWALVWSAVLAAPAAIGATIRTRSQSAAAVHAEQARRAASEEQLRMAQDLHDAVGHGLAVIAMQAGVALHVLDRQPQRARESLEAIRDTSREALGGLRVELDRLRAPVDEAPRRRPGPGVADVQVLVDRMRAGGLDVRLEVTSIGELPADLDQAAYRIVQESLTNVLRHAGRATAEVRVTRSAGDLLIEVADTGSGGSAAPGSSADGAVGTGIEGMRSRAAVLGGGLVAGPRAGSGFAVRAWLPITGSPGPGRDPGAPTIRPAT